MVSGCRSGQQRQHEEGSGKADQAYPFLMQKLLPAGLRGIMFAALFGGFAPPQIG